MSTSFCATMDHYGQRTLLFNVLTIFDENIVKYMLAVHSIKQAITLGVHFL